MILLEIQIKPFIQLDLLVYSGSAIPKEQLLKTRGSLHDFRLDLEVIIKREVSAGAVINIPTGTFLNATIHIKNKKRLKENFFLL